MRIRPLDEDSGKLLDVSGCDWMVVRAGGGFTRESALSGLVVETGHYRLLVTRPGYYPKEMPFTVGSSGSSLTVDVPMKKGDAGILSGKVVGKVTNRPVRCNVSCTHVATGMGDKLVECPSGRFRFTGLMAGDYVLTVEGQEESRDFRFTIGENEKKEDLALALEGE